MCIKTIIYNRETRDYAMYLDGDYIGSRATYPEAEAAIDHAAWNRLHHAQATADAEREPEEPHEIVSPPAA